MSILQTSSAKLGFPSWVFRKRDAEDRSQVCVAALGCLPRLPTKQVMAVLSCGYGKTSFEIPGPFTCWSQSLVFSWSSVDMFADGIRVSLQVFLSRFMGGITTLTLLLPTSIPTGMSTSACANGYRHRFLDLAGSEGLEGMTVVNIKPQGNRFVFPDINRVIVLASGSRIGVRHRRPSFLVLPQHNTYRYLKKNKACQNGVYLLP